METHHASRFWNSKQILRVHLSGDTAAGSFSTKLLQIGNGAIPEVSSSNGSMIKIPEGCGKVVKDSCELYNKVYPNLKENYKNESWLKVRAILAPRNDLAASINTTLLQQLPCNFKNFKSFDTMVEESESVNYPMEHR